MHTAFTYTFHLHKQALIQSILLSSLKLKSNNHLRSPNNILSLTNRYIFQLLSIENSKPF